MSAEGVVAANVTKGALAASSLTGSMAGATFMVLGIPIWGLAAGLLGAFFSYIPRAGVDQRHVPTRFLGVLSDGTVGGWIAVFGVHASKLSNPWVLDVPIEVFCGILGFGMHFARAKGGVYIERAFGVALSSLSSVITSWKRGGGVQPAVSPPPSPPSGGGE